LTYAEVPYDVVFDQEVLATRRSFGEKVVRTWTRARLRLRARWER